jgi:SH3-like domain-containing protein
VNFDCKRIIWTCFAVFFAATGPIAAQQATQSANAPASASLVGPESNLPLPRFVSLKTAEANVRRGPSLTHRIDWVFQRRNMPMQVIAEYGHWRRVVDRDGQGGWIHFRLLSGNRTVIINDALLPLRSRASEDSAIVAQLEAGVVASLGECSQSWCRLTAGGYRGWATKAVLWGVDDDELRD